MESEEFDAYLELYGPSDRQPVVEDDDGGLRANALIEQFELDETGTFVIVAGGASRNDVGAYTLALVVEPAELSGTPAVNPTSTATQRATATRAPTKRPTLRPTRRPTATRTSTPTPEPDVCVVQISSLNLRSGPGVIYEPPIGGIPRNAELIPLARNAGRHLDPDRSGKQRPHGLGQFGPAVCGLYIRSCRSAARSSSHRHPRPRPRRRPPRPPPSHRRRLQRRPHRRRPPW